MEILEINGEMYGMVWYGMVWYIKKIDENLENACIKNVSGRSTLVYASISTNISNFSFSVFNDSIQELSILN